MKGNECGVYIGGLFRCCIQSISEDEKQRKPGDILVCKYCKKGEMILGEDMHWKWKK